MIVHNDNNTRSLDELIDSYLSDTSVEEFDRIVESAGNKASRVRILKWTAGLAAAFVAVALVVTRFLPQCPEQFPVVDIAEGINMLMDMNIGDIKSITAVPTGPTAMLTVAMQDGSTHKYILTRNGEDSGTISILAMN